MRVLYPYHLDYVLYFPHGGKNLHLIQTQHAHPLPPTRQRVHALPEIRPGLGIRDYGTLSCLQCAGRHRSLGGNVSFVKVIVIIALLSIAPPL